MKTPSKHTLALSAAQAETHLHQLALSDLCNGAVRWFGNPRTFSLGVSRPKGAAGGIVIERVGGMSSAYYFEDYAARMLANIASLVTGADTERNCELLHNRAVIEDAKAYVAEQQRTL